jgi:fumarate hydratase class II
MSSRDRGSPSSSSSSSSLPGIEKYNEKVKNQIQALVRVIKVARTYRDDNVPSLIEQVTTTTNTHRFFLPTK